MTKQVVAQSQLRAVPCCDFHQAVGHVHGITRRRNVLIAAAAKAGCNDGAEVRADLEAGLRRDRLRKRFDPLFGAVAKVDAAKSGIAGIVRGALRQAEQDHGAVPQKARNDSAARDDLAADLAFEITFARNLVPRRPGRRYERKTKRPGGRYKTRKPGDTTRLTPLTRIVFWLMPVPTLT